MEMILAPSILAADFTKLGEQMKETEREGAQYIHFDVMDGKFVPSISFGMPVLASIRNAVDQIFDVHLMIEEPIRYVEEFQKAGADIITVHLEACSDVKATLEKIKACGAKAAISICPDTPVAELELYVELVDMVLIMEVSLSSHLLWRRFERREHCLIVSTQPQILKWMVESIQRM